MERATATTRDHGIESPDDGASSGCEDVQLDELLLWAYHTATTWSRERIAERVIAHRDEWPSEQQFERIVSSVDSDVLQREVSVGYNLSGNVYSDLASLSSVPNPQKRLLKQQLARILVLDDIAEELFWPESSVTLDDVPRWMADRISVDPITIKTEQYNDIEMVSYEHLAPVVRDRVSDDHDCSDPETT